MKTLQFPTPKKLLLAFSEVVDYLSDSFKKFKLSYGGNMHKKQKDNREKQ